MNGAFRWRRQSAPIVIAMAVIVGHAASLAGQAPAATESTPTQRVEGTIWTQLPGGESLRGVGATVYLWVDTPQLHTALTAACTSARANPLPWIAARTELESPAGVPLDSATTADLVILHDIASVRHAVATANSRGDFTFDDVPLGEYWLEAEMPHGSEIVQWWHPLSLASVDIAAARLVGLAGKARVVELGSHDFTRDEFCAHLEPRDRMVGFGKEILADSSAAPVDYVYERVDVPAKVAVPGPPPVYPEILRQTATGGQVDFEFVVDTLGNADPRTFRVLRSTNLDFASAVRESIMRTLYEPARMHGHKVRQRLQQSFIFSVSTTELH